jgi:hypothetical protein
LGRKGIGLRAVEEVAGDEVEDRPPVAPPEGTPHRLPETGLEVVVGGLSLGRCPEPGHDRRLGEHQRPDQLRMTDGEDESAVGPVRFGDDMGRAQPQLLDQRREIVRIDGSGVSGVDAGVPVREVVAPAVGERLVLP